MKRFFELIVQPSLKRKGESENETHQVSYQTKM